MKFFAPALIFCGAAAAFGQSPQVPHKMPFAGMTLTIRDDARREIQKDVDALTQSPKYFSIKAERAKTYFPIIEKIFTEERLPVDFKYLAIQESALVSDAVSSSNAVGFWQFKDFTAMEMGMRVDDAVDERMNIESASRGAARYLKQCNHYFNNWIYALQSYQMGAGGVMRAVGDKDLGSRHMEINTDTYWYVKKFIAHKVAFESSLDGRPATEVAVIQAGGKSMKEIAQTLNVKEDLLRTFNKWLKAERIPEDKPYAVLIPKGEMAPEFSVLTVPSTQKVTAPVAIAPMAGAPETNLEINGIPVIRALEYESIAAIAERGGISIGRFLSFNEMEIDKPMVPGQLYFLEKKKKHGSQELYTVRPGEDVWSVSQQFGIRQTPLMKYNQINSATTSVSGVTLFLNASRPGATKIEADSVVALLDEDTSFDWDLSLSAARANNIENIGSLDTNESVTRVPVESRQSVAGVEMGQSVHEVQPSDTLYSVARQYGVTIKEIMDWNGKKDFGLSIGEKLKVSAH